MNVNSKNSKVKPFQEGCHLDQKKFFSKCLDCLEFAKNPWACPVKELIKSNFNGFENVLPTVLVRFTTLIYDSNIIEINHVSIQFRPLFWSKKFPNIWWK